MQTLLYFLALGLVRLLQALPLPVVAWVGRRAGTLAWAFDRRHRRVALENLIAAFEQEKSPREVRALAREHFRRLGENYASGVKTASMKLDQLAQHVEFVGLDRVQPPAGDGAPQSRIFAIGHFGNFELYAWAGHFIQGYKMVTTYRALSQPRLNGLLVSLREQTGCTVFERRKEQAAFFQTVHQPGLFVGLLSDQHAGRAGAWLPFLRRPCSTSTAPALIAQRYGLPLFTAICYRTRLAHWRIEIGPEIPTLQAGRRRSVEEVMLDVNRAFEVAVRRDPANWFWVHRRWKPQRSRAVPKTGQPLDVPA